jgi:hypothetical protein
VIRSGKRQHIGSSFTQADIPGVIRVRERFGDYALIEDELVPPLKDDMDGTFQRRLQIKVACPAPFAKKAKNGALGRGPTLGCNHEREAHITALCYSSLQSSIAG